LPTWLRLYSARTLQDHRQPQVDLASHQLHDAVEVLIRHASRALERDSNVFDERFACRRQSPDQRGPRDAEHGREVRSRNTVDIMQAQQCPILRVQLRTSGREGIPHGLLIHLLEQRDFPVGPRDPGFERSFDIVRMPLSLALQRERFANGGRPEPTFERTGGAVRRERRCLALVANQTASDDDLTNFRHQVRVAGQASQIERDPLGIARKKLGYRDGKAFDAGAGEIDIRRPLRISSPCFQACLCKGAECSDSQVNRRPGCAPEFEGIVARDGVCRHES
jgi:hypothetical protein